MTFDLLHAHDPAESPATEHAPAPGRSSTQRLAARGGGPALLGLADAAATVDEAIHEAGDEVEADLDDPFGLHLDGDDALGAEGQDLASDADADIDADAGADPDGPGLAEDDDEQGDAEADLRAASRSLADVVAEGESKLGRGGDPYTARNSGTQNKKIVGTRYEKGLDRMSLAQIRARRNAAGTDRLFAVGKYQIIPGTLDAAMKKMKLDGSEVFDASLQDRIFLEYLVLGGKQPLLTGYLAAGRGSVEDAVMGAAMEWASIEVPAGRRTSKGGTSTGRSSYWGGANGAKAGSGARVGAAIERMRDEIVAVFGAAPLDAAKVKRVGAIAAGKGGDTTTTPTTPTPTTPTTPTPTTTTPTTTTEAAKTPQLPGGLTTSVGRGGANDADEVGRVQQRLEELGLSPGAIDRKVGPRTIGAIERAQRALGMTRPDGLIEPGKRTERGLFGTEGALLGVVEVRADDETPTTEADPATRARVVPTKATTGTPLPVKAGVTMTSYLTQMSAVLQPYVPRGTRVSSGLRTTERQRQILRGLWAKHRGPAAITDEVAQCKWLRGRGVHVAPPGRSNHEKGRAIDLSGAALGAIEAAVARAQREQPDAGIVKTLQEDRQNCVHVDLAGGA